MKLDAAFAVFHRTVLESFAGPIYLWADSSPQLGADWLLSIYDYLPRDHVVQAWKAANTLEAAAVKFQALFTESDFDTVAPLDVLEQLVQDRYVAAKFLSTHLCRHRQMPMALGSAAVTMVHKVKALAMKFAHETSNFSCLFLHS